MKDPIKVYLDTSDYIQLYTKRNDWQESLFQFLIEKSMSNEIVVVYSYSIIMELLQDYSQEYREDRLARAEIVKTLCGRNTLRFFMEIEDDDNDVFSNACDWNPSFVKEALEINSFIKKLVFMMVENETTHKSIRKKLLTKKGLTRFIKKHPELLDSRNIDFVFPEEFYKRDVLNSYILGKISRDSANALLLEMLNDPVLFFINYYDVGQFSNYFVAPFHTMSKTLKEGIEKVTILAQNSKQAESLILDFDPELYWDKIYDFFPQYIRHILKSFFQDNYKTPHFQQSDMADMTHALYLPHTDIWRGDKHFSNLLIRQKIPHHEKIVPKLRDLPQRIEAALKSRQS
ncbi:MAG: hypothetical protein AB7E51_09235 [Pseudodesulfovibrio sp.]|uniref:hypothetical protein n=1 Tax=Pseudodesulfovibrio sp. TaxID=2035812 RepID=UPI003D0DC5D1